MTEVYYLVFSVLITSTIILGVPFIFRQGIILVRSYFFIKKLNVHKGLSGSDHENDLGLDLKSYSQKTYIISGQSQFYFVSLMFLSGSR